MQLTILNSVVAVVMLSQELFPDVPVSMVHMSVSVGVMNAVGPFFGCMPCCHGAGGLAAQVRFGAKTGVAPMLLGVIKTCLGLLFGSSLFELFRSFPEPLLGVMLVLSGVELASTASKQPDDKAQWCESVICNL
jgi:MFS superfamily sulfate permease-like transporter